MNDLNHMGSSHPTESLCSSERKPTHFNNIKMLFEHHQYQVFYSIPQYPLINMY